MNGLRGRGPIGPGDSTRAGLNVQRPQTMQPAGAMEPARQQAQELRRDFFVYTITFDDLASGAAAQGAIQIQADSDFEMQKLTAFADIAGAVQTDATRVLPLVTIQLQDTGTGRNLFSAPVAVPGLFGDGQIPFILPTSKWFTRNASVAVQVANFSAATTYDLRIYLIGSKVFKYS
jgi:hypothetical protein